MHQAYLARHLDDVLKSEKLCVVGVAEDLNVLTVGVRDIQLPANPTSSFSAITQKTSSLKFLPTIQMLVEVMQRVDPGDDFMAMAELIALDLAAETRWWHF